MEKGKRNHYRSLYTNLLKHFEETEMFYISTNILVPHFCFISSQNAINFLNDRTGMCTQNATPIRLQRILKEVSRETGNDSDSISMAWNRNLAQINELQRKN